MVRDYIVAHGEELTNIINNNNFKHYFQLSGFKLKNCPRGYDKESPYVELLKHKSWYVEAPIANNELHNGNELLLTLTKKYEALKPLNDFLNKALVNFVLPKRK